MNAIKRLLSLAAFAAAVPCVVNAGNYTIPKFRINQYYDSNAVLQRGVKLPISGTAAWGASVSVTFNNQTIVTTADIEGPFKGDGEGRWTAEFPAMAAGGPYTLTVSDGTKTLTATNIMVGEVWLVSGQSNAQYKIKEFADSEQWIREGDCPNVRFLMAGSGHYSWALNQNSWNIASTGTVGSCSAMAFFFGRELQKHVGVTVGMVTAAVDGSKIQAWLPEGEWYNKMIISDLEPLTVFPVKGVAWYQGESNGMFAEGYKWRFLLQDMISDWRNQWKNQDLPFLVVQLPIFKDYSLWYEVRDSANWVGANMDNVFVVPTLDIGDMNNIHPPKKPELGVKLSDFARKYVYGETSLHPEGPVYRNFEVRGNEIYVHFDVTSPITSGNGEMLNGFQVGGEHFGRSQQFINADTVRIVSADTVAVYAKDIPNPEAVRYGMKNFDPVNFFDADGYPAGAFRTDSWKLPTQSDEPQHEHGWKLSASGDTLTAVCTNENCTAASWPKFSLGGEATKAYDGSPLEATKLGTEFAALTESSLGSIEYYHEGVKLSDPPIAIGVYEARCDVEHKGVVYTVVRTLTITEPPPKKPSVVLYAD